MIEIGLYLLLILSGFLLGGIMFGQALPKFLKGKDVYLESEDHNPGTVNAFVVGGFWVGSLTLICDFMKGFLPVFIACKFLNTDSFLFSLVVFAPVLGHALGIFNHNHGGKCIATTFGVQVATFYVSWSGLLLAIIYVVFSTIIKINPNRKRSIITFILFGILATINLTVGKNFSLAFGDFLISITVILKHLKYFENHEFKLPINNFMEIFK